MSLELDITYEKYKNTPLPLHDHPNQIKHLQIECVEEWFVGLCKSEDYIWGEEIWTDKMGPCVLFTNIVNFDNLISLKLGSVALETKYWVEFAMNSKCLKELELFLTEDVESRDFFNFSEEALESLLKIPTLENVYLHTLRLDFFPKGTPTLRAEPEGFTLDGNEMMKKQSNVKEFKLRYWLHKKRYDDANDEEQNNYWNYGLSPEFNNSFATNIGTYVHLERLELMGMFEIDNIDAGLNNIINNCPKLNEFKNTYDSCKLETLVKLIQMPNIKLIHTSIDSDGTEEFQLELMKNCDLSKLEKFRVHYSSKYPNLYEKIYTILKKTCPRLVMDYKEEDYHNEKFTFTKSGPTVNKMI